MDDTSFYLVQLKPFGEDERHDSKIVQPHQKKCIEGHICGMGWPYGDEFFNDERVVLKEYYDKYLNYSRCKEGKRRIITSSLNCYWHMKTGDYVFTRLDDNTCYIGRVDSEAYHSKAKQLEVDSEYGCNYSWIVDVEWKLIGDGQTVPGCLKGELAKRLNTVQRISSDVSRKTIVKLYNNDDTKTVLNVNTFADVFDPNELEDLVACYVQYLHRDENLLFIPSTCKKDTKKYEFLLTDGVRKISLQVKNKKDIDAKPYIDDVKARLYDTVYLFSNKRVLNLSETETSGVMEITKQELFDYLKGNFSDDSYFGERLNKIYALE